MKIGQSGFAKKQLLNTLSNEGTSLSRNLMNLSASSQLSGGYFIEKSHLEDLRLGGVSGRIRPEDVLRQKHIMVVLKLKIGNQMVEDCL